MIAGLDNLGGVGNKLSTQQPQKDSFLLSRRAPKGATSLQMQDLIRQHQINGALEIILPTQYLRIQVELLRVNAGIEEIISTTES